MSCVTMLAVLDHVLYGQLYSVVSTGFNKMGWDSDYLSNLSVILFNYPRLLPKPGVPASGNIH